MRTQEEITTRAKKILEHPLSMILGPEDLLEMLDLEHIKKVIPNVADTTWKEAHVEYTKENVIKRIKDYLPFAFEKANNQRGISASRSIEHMKNWLWLLGDDELLAVAENDDNYPEYGLPILEKIKAKYGVA